MSVGLKFKFFNIFLIFLSYTFLFSCYKSDGFKIPIDCTDPSGCTPGGDDDFGSGLGASGDGLAEDGDVLTFRWNDAREDPEFPEMDDCPKTLGTVADPDGHLNRDKNCFYGYWASLSVQGELPDGSWETIHYSDPHYDRDGNLSFNPDETEFNIIVDLESRFYSIFYEFCIQPIMLLGASFQRMLEMECVSSQGVPKKESDLRVEVIGSSDIIEGNSGFTPVDVIYSIQTPRFYPIRFFAGFSYGSCSSNDISLSFGINSTITFSPGETQRTFRLYIVGDTRVESNETCSPYINNTVNVFIENGYANAPFTIVNDDVAQMLCQGVPVPAPGQVQLMCGVCPCMSPF